MTDAQLTIFIVDDSVRDIRLLSEALQESRPGIAIRAIVTSEELHQGLLGATPNPPPDGIVLDYRMPVMSGLEVLGALAGNPSWSAVPKIMLTGIQDVTIIGQCQRAGATDVRFKPRTYSDYLTLARDIIRRCQLSRAERTPLSLQPSGSSAPAGATTP